MCSDVPKSKIVSNCLFNFSIGSFRSQIISAFSNFEKSREFKDFKLKFKITFIRNIV